MGQQPLSASMGGHTEGKDRRMGRGSCAVDRNLCLPVQLSVAESK